MKWDVRNLNFSGKFTGFSEKYRGRISKCICFWQNSGCARRHFLKNGDFFIFCIFPVFPEEDIFLHPFCKFSVFSKNFRKNIFTNFCKFLQIFVNFCKFLQIFTNFYKILQNFAKFLQILDIFRKFFSRGCQILQILDIFRFSRKFYFY